MKKMQQYEYVLDTQFTHFGYCRRYYFFNLAQEVCKDIWGRFSESSAPHIFNIVRDIAYFTQDQMTIVACYTKFKKIIG